MAELTALSSRRFFIFHIRGEDSRLAVKDGLISTIPIRQVIAENEFYSFRFSFKDCEIRGWPAEYLPL